MLGIYHIDTRRTLGPIPTQPTLVNGLGRGLGLHYIQPVPLAHEPPVVARMARALSTYDAQKAKGWLAGVGDAATDVDTWGGLVFKLALVGGMVTLMGISYYGCVKRGACKGF